MQTITKKPIAWGWIILAFILFWPVGAVLLFMRLNTDKAATIKSGNTIAIISYILMGLGVFYLLMALYGRGGGSILFAIACGIGGFWINRVAKKTKATGEKYKQYISLVVNESQTSIDTIAALVGVPYEVAVQDLQSMINAGFFTGAYIDLSARVIALAQTQVVYQQQSAVIVQERVVVCSSCGAHNRVIRQVGECEYCGSPLQ